MGDKVGFLSTLMKLGDFIRLLNALFAVKEEIEDGDNEPIDLMPVAMAGHEIARDFNIPIPSWANNTGYILTFIEGGIEKCQNIRALSVDHKLQGHAEVDVLNLT